MGRKKRGNVEVKAISRIEAVAKATYHREKITTEVVPPDVSRAKAGAWLTLISPITEWAGLKGDALKFKRRMLRIQQEETLLRVAQSVRKKLSATTVIEPIQRKILVPALEKASLEDAADDTMIERWANLLASAAMKVSVQPRFVSILEELAGNQAECLDHIAFNNFEKFKFPYRDLSNAPYVYAEHFAKADLQSVVTKNLKSKKDIDKTLDAILEFLASPGVFVELVLVGEPRENGAEVGYDSVSETGIRREDDLPILESLGLIRRVVVEVEIKAQRARVGAMRASIYYYHLTTLGLAFCEVCSRPMLLKLESIDENNMSKSTDE